MPAASWPSPKAISAGALAYTLDGSAPPGIPLLISGDGERQLRLALGAQDVGVDLDLGAGG
jgi:hypothetical protein